MLPVSLGLVTVAASGTQVPLATATDTNFGRPQAADLWANRVVVKAPPNTATLTGNAGPIYIGTKGFNKTTGAGLLVILLPGDSQAIGSQQVGNWIWVPGLYMDADNNGDGIIGEADVI